MRPNISKIRNADAAYESLSEATPILAELRFRKIHERDVDVPKT